MKSVKFTMRLRKLDTPRSTKSLRIEGRTFRLRFQHAVNQLDNPQKIVETKKTSPVL